MDLQEQVGRLSHRTSGVEAWLVDVRDNGASSAGAISNLRDCFRDLEMRVESYAQAPPWHPQEPVADPPLENVNGYLAEELLSRLSAVEDRIDRQHPPQELAVGISDEDWRNFAEHMQSMRHQVFTEVDARLEGLASQVSAEFQRLTEEVRSQLSETGSCIQRLSEDLAQVSQYAQPRSPSIQSIRAAAGAALEEELDALCTEVMERVDGKANLQQGEDATDASSDEIAALIAAERAFRKLQAACTHAAQEISITTACDGAEKDNVEVLSAADALAQDLVQF